MYFKQIGFFKESSYYSVKRLKREDLLLLANKFIETSDPRNAKQHYQSFLRKKNGKSVKQSKIISYQPKILKTQTLLI